MKMKYYFRENRAVKLNEDGTETTELLDVTKYSFVAQVEFNKDVGTMCGEVIGYVEPVQPEVETPTEVKDLEEVK